MSEVKRTTVINLRGKDHAAIRASEDHVYIGRWNGRCGFSASPFANPFRPGMTWSEACRVAGTLETPAPYETLDRAAAVRWYSHWLSTQPLLLNSVGDLKGKTLCCYCVDWDGEGEPDGYCHGTVLARLADAAPDPAARAAALGLESATA